MPTCGAPSSSPCSLRRRPSSAASSSRPSNIATDGLVAQRVQPNEWITAPLSQLREIVPALNRTLPVLFHQQRATAEFQDLSLGAKRYPVARSRQQLIRQRYSVPPFVPDVI